MHNKQKKTVKIWKIVGGIWTGALIATLGLTLAPDSLAQATSDISVQVMPSFTVENPIEIDTPVMQAEIDQVTTTTAHVLVHSNNPSGWTMQLSMADSDTHQGALMHETLTSDIARIPSAHGTLAAPTPLNSNTWGYRLSSFSAGRYAAVPSFSSPDQIASSNNAGDFDIPVQLGVRPGFIPSGTYSNEIAILTTAND